MDKILGQKTLKREFGVVLMVAILYMIWTNNTEMLEITLVPFLTYIATAAGIHTLDKNSSITRSAGPGRL